MSKPIVAAQLYTLRNQMKTPEDIALGLKKVKQMGYQAVQVSGIGPIDHVHLKDLVDQEGLEICATHIGWDRLVSDLDGVIKQHQLWNCKYVGLGSMPEKYRSSKEGYIQFAKEASLVGRKLRDQGLQFIYHNHAFEFQKFDGVTGMELLFSESDPMDFHFEIDTYWVQIGGANPVTWIRKVANRMKVVHFKDMGNAGENQPIMAEVGEGNLEWPEIIKACSETNVEYAAVEQDVCQRDPFESLAMSYRNLKNLGL